MKKFAVFGNPIAHSLSPVIHNMFAVELNEAISYEKICAPVDNFESSISTFFNSENAKGCNVTVPFKENAFRMASELEKGAKLAKAVNTLVRNDDGSLSGFNTDGVGLVNDLLNATVSVEGARVLLLGAGGAARGVVHPLLDAGVSHISILNRSFDKADILAQEAEDSRVVAVTVNDSSNIADIDIVINSTSASLSGLVPAIPEGVFDNNAVAYDMLYAKEPTRFMSFAAKQGAKIQLDGLGMLVEQAAAAFKIWTGKQPDTAPVLQKLRIMLANENRP